MGTRRFELCILRSGARPPLQCPIVVESKREPGLDEWAHRSFFDVLLNKATLMGLEMTEFDRETICHEMAVRGAQGALGAGAAFDAFCRQIQKRDLRGGFARRLNLRLREAPLLHHGDVAWCAAFDRNKNCQPRAFLDKITGNNQRLKILHETSVLNIIGRFF